MTWDNRGVAPAYHPYVLKIRLAGPETIDFELESGCCKWMPVSTHGIYNEKYVIAVPDETPPGRYELKIKLYSKEENEDVLLALDPALMDDENYYKIAAVTAEK